MDVKTFSRKQLYNLVWSKPLTSLSKEYAISDNGLRKICKKHNIPLPKLGYWQKKKYGKKVTVRPLPKASDDITITIKLRTGDRELLNKEASEYVKLKREIESDTSLNFVVPDKLSKSHVLVKKTRKDLQSKKTSRWSTNHGLVYSSSGVLNMKVSKSSIGRALLFMNSLIQLIEQRGHKFKIEERKTYAIINEEKLELRCQESLKRSVKKDKTFSWDTYEYHPSGNLRLILENTYPKKTWNDGKKRKLEDSLSSILTILE